MLVIVIKIRKSGLKDFMPSSESPLFSLKKFPQRETKKKKNKKQKAKALQLQWHQIYRISKEFSWMLFTAPGEKNYRGEVTQQSSIQSLPPLIHRSWKPQTINFIEVTIKRQFAYTYSMEITEKRRSWT